MGQSCSYVLCQTCRMQGTWHLGLALEDSSHSVSTQWFDCFQVFMINKNPIKFYLFWILCMFNLSLNILLYHQARSFTLVLVNCMQKVILCKRDFVLNYEFGFQHVICTGLWCKVESESECKTKLDPPMDGTDCDTGKVCSGGKSNINDIEHLTVKETSWTDLYTCLKFLLASVFIKILIE